MSDTDKETCCFLHDDDVDKPCQNSAEFQIQYDRAPDNFSLACVYHVGHLLEDGKVHTVFQFEEA